MSSRQTDVNLTGACGGVPVCVTRETDPEVNTLSAINPDEIISILKEEIDNYDEISQNQEVGTVISVGDGIATVYGIDHANAW